MQQCEDYLSFQSSYRNSYHCSLLTMLTLKTINLLIYPKHHQHSICQKLSFILLSYPTIHQDSPLFLPYLESLNGGDRVRPLKCNNIIYWDSFTEATSPTSVHVENIKIA